ncbi:unnamed protein product [Timema podura]|uniref:Uncharacterized protein n=1 Tax=Timema podura TaxID=61482 RepID=A0ABN7PFW1_TIMPD|nr:unnamed protein product [Timema podura]
MPVELLSPDRDSNLDLSTVNSLFYCESYHARPRDHLKVKEGFGNQINRCWDQGLKPGPLEQKSDTSPLDHQVTIGLLLIQKE